MIQALGAEGDDVRGGGDGGVSQPYHRSSYSLADMCKGRVVESLMKGPIVDILYGALVVYPHLVDSSPVLYALMALPQECRHFVSLLLWHSTMVHVSC